MSYYSDIFSITIKGDKTGVIRMLNAAISNVGTGNVICEGDDVDTMIHKLKEEDGKHLLRLSVLDLMDDVCIQDKVIQEKKAAFERKMDYYRDVLDGKISFESEDEESSAMYEADSALEDMFDGRFIDISGVDIHDGICDVRMEFYIGEEPMSYPDWADWGDVCRLYGCRVVIDDDEYLNGAFYKFCGTTIYDMEDGTMKKNIIKPDLGFREYVSSMDTLVRMDPERYRERKIKDMKVRVSELQEELSMEMLQLELDRLDETSGHLQVPEGVTRISEVTWKYSKKIKSIYIPTSVEVINKNSISDSNIETIEISPDNPYFCSVNNCILNKEKTALLIGCKGSVIPDGIVEIENSAFCSCGIKEIRFPGSVMKIGRDAFNGCSRLTRLEFKDGVKELGIYAFMGCSSLVSVTLPNSLEDLPIRCFYGCTSLTDVILPEHLKDSDNEAFENTPYGGGVEERQDPELPF